MSKPNFMELVLKDIPENDKKEIKRILLFSAEKSPTKNLSETIAIITKNDTSVGAMFVMEIKKKMDSFRVNNYSQSWIDNVVTSLSLDEDALNIFYIASKPESTEQKPKEVAKVKIDMLTDLTKYTKALIKKISDIPDKTKKKDLKDKIEKQLLAVHNKLYESGSEQKFLEFIQPFKSTDKVNEMIKKYPAFAEDLQLISEAIHEMPIETLFASPEERNVKVYKEYLDAINVVNTDIAHVAYSSVRIPFYDKIVDTFYNKYFKEMPHLEFLKFNAIYLDQKDLKERARLFSIQINILIKDRTDIYADINKLKAEIHETLEVQSESAIGLLRSYRKLVAEARDKIELNRKQATREKASKIIDQTLNAIKTTISDKSNIFDQYLKIEDEKLKSFIVTDPKMKQKILEYDTAIRQAFEKMETSIDSILFPI